MGSLEPKSMMLFITQMLIVLIVVVTSITNLSLNKDGNREFWISLLCSTIGYILPNPRVKTLKKKGPEHSDTESEYATVDLTDSAPKTKGNSDPVPQN
jgi:hypothetical protein